MSVKLTKYSGCQLDALQVGDTFMLSDSSGIYQIMDPGITESGVYSVVWHSGATLHLKRDALVLPVDVEVIFTPRAFDT